MFVLGKYRKIKQRSFLKKIYVFILKLYIYIYIYYGYFLFLFMWIFKEKVSKLETIQFSVISIM